MRRFLNWLGRCIAYSIAALLGATIAIAASPWLIFKTWEMLAKLGF